MDYQALNSIGNLITARRIEKRITTSQLAILAGMDEWILSNIQYGWMSEMRLESYCKLARPLELPLDLVKAVELAMETPWRSGYETAELLGQEVCANIDDFLPIKNHLPADLGASLKTRRQWEELGFSLKPDAEPYEMHPSAVSRRTSIYYHVDDVVGDKGDEFQEEQRKLVADLEKATGHGGLSNLKNPASSQARMRSFRGPRYRAR